MKKMFLMAAVGCMGFYSCEKLEVPSEEIGGGNFEETEYTRKVTFTVKGDFRNMEFASPTDGISVDSTLTDDWGEGKARITSLAEQHTRANEYMIANGVEMTDLWVVDYKDGVIKQTIHQGKGDEDWGSPSMQLTLGTHHVMFLASRGQNPTYADGVVTWTKPIDTFYKDYEITVAKTSNGNRSVTLDRVATRLTIVIEDAIPAACTVTMEPELWYTGWNMLKGEPVANDSYVASYHLDQSYVGVENMNLNMWGLSVADEWTTNVSVTSTIDGASVQIDNAPLKANRTSCYSGTMFANGSNSTVSLNATWLKDYEARY